MNNGQVEDIRGSGLADAIPVYVKYTAKGFPVVGTTLDYFDFRNLRVSAGRLPGMLGEAVIGAKVAAALHLAPGDKLLSDQANIYDISKSYPLNMHVAGVLAETGTPDDSAVFVDIKTAWIIEGLGHGHMDVVGKSGSDYLLERTKENVAAGAALPEYNEITNKNLASFHFHGNLRDFPLTAVIVIPSDEKSGTILSARLNLSKTVYALVPLDVVQELMGIVFKVKRFFDANFAIITLSTILFLVLVVMLSLRIRTKERETMHKIGCSRTTVFWIQAGELIIIFGISIVLTGVLSIIALNFVPHIFKMM